MERLGFGPVLVDAVHERLTSAIANMQLRPGERIRQDELAERLGVSRQPISHALQLLKQQGLVRETGRKGLVVAPIEPNRIVDLYEVRAVVDGLAARRAADRVSRDDMTAAEREALRRAADWTPGGADVADLVSADMRFHQSIYELSGNPAILEMLSPRWPHLQRSMMSVLQVGSYRDRAWAEHRLIADLILMGNADEAERAARRHAEEAGRETARRLNETADA